MRKISKVSFPATVFQTEIAKYNTTNHPDYSKGVFRNNHYSSVFWGLLICQKGLCAYTESLLTNDTNLLNASGSFKAGMTAIPIPTSSIDADIEHYDSNLKKTKGWQFDNLFLCRVFINRDIKKDKETLPFLKPDDPSYSPEIYLSYNFKRHHYTANPALANDVKEKINYQLNFVLGINSETIVSERRSILESAKRYIQDRFKTYEEVLKNEVNAFYTAFVMSKADLESQ